MLGACALSAAGQQVDGDFETFKDCKIYVGQKETKTYGKDPNGWNGSNIYQIGTAVGDKKDKNLITQVSGKNGKAVQIQNLFEGFLNIGATAPGYITLGTPWAYAKVENSTNIVDSDGGSFGGKNFSYRPDAISFDYKRTYKKPTIASGNSGGIVNKSEHASIIAYLWKGKYTGKAYVGYNGKEEEMVDRDRYVLGMDNSCTKSADAKLIASLNDYVTTATSWTTKTIEFKYEDENTIPERINIIFCAGDYFGDQTKLGNGNQLILDNVQLIYYHTLASLSYDGEEIADFDTETTEYDLSDVEYDASKLSYEKNGVGATVEKSYDDESAVLTITVKGNNYVEDDEDTFTTYTIQFKKPEPQGIETEYQNGLYIDARAFNNSGEQFEENKSIKLVNYPDLDNRYDLLLNDFVFYLNGMPLNVGDILVKDLDKTQEGNALHLTTQSQLVEINGLGSLPISVDATLENNELTAKIAIEGLGINVTFAPAYNLTDGVSIPTTSLSNLQFTRTFKSGWNTLILPFATTAEQLGAEEVDQLSSLSTDHNWVNFEKVESGELEANKPYLVKFADAQDVTLYYGGEVTTAGDLTTTASATSGNGQVSYVGNYVASMNMNGKYGVYEDQIVQGGTNALLPSTACYFEFKNVANPAALSVKFGNGETTSISTITAPAAAKAAGVYNIQGIKLNSTGSTAGLPAGLYIVNGQKVLVK